MIRRLAAVSLLFVLLLIAGAEFSRSARASCDRPGDVLCCPNVLWSLKDSLSACPAGDSVFAGHPAKLRIALYYSDADCNARVGVPPESIWVQVISHTGNLAVNDEGAKIFADDSTDTGGFARITIPSFSGCGTVSIRVFVSNSIIGTKVVTVRTTDYDGNGRADSEVGAAGCDLNYDGLVNLTDKLIRLSHNTDWHRNALFGTLVRRTNLCETCKPESTGTIGDSEIFWSPDGKQLAFTIHVGPVGTDTVAACRIFLARSDPHCREAL